MLRLIHNDKRPERHRLKTPRELLDSLYYRWLTSCAPYERRTILRLALLAAFTLLMGVFIVGNLKGS